LLDLSLYVSSANYTTVTRPAYSRLLSWPDRWFRPSERRAKAKARTEHLNLSSFNSDNIDPDQQEAKSASDFIPGYLRNSRQSVSEVVKQPHVASRIRLDGIADAFFEPLKQLLGNKPFLLSETAPSSLDCLAFAYLALALIPVLPEPWLAESVSQYPSLCGYVKELNHRFWGPVDTDGAIPKTWSGDAAGSNFSQKESRNGYSLPWKESRHEGRLVAGSAALTLFENTLGSLPVLGGYWKRGIIPSSQTSALSELNANTPRRDGIINSAPLLHIGPGVLATGTALAALGSYLFYHSQRTS
jgi:sorting and assembly machinery component 37